VRVVLKLAEGVPLVWRSPSSIQVGVDDPTIVLEDVTPGVERLIAALRAGISSSGWTMLGRDAGVPAGDARTLLDRLGPVLTPEGGEASAPFGAGVLVTGEGPLASGIADLLRERGLLAPPDREQPELAVLVADWVLPPDAAARWLRRDVPHLPVIVSDRSIAIGPFVEPGRGPCVHCLQLARRDADPAWPAIAAQLWGRPAPHHSRLAVQAAAGHAARRLIARLTDGPGTIGRGWRLCGDGGTVSAWTAWVHPACSCAAPPESDWAPGSGPAHPGAPRTG